MLETPMRDEFDEAFNAAMGGNMFEEIELTTTLMIAASQCEERPCQEDIDQLLGLVGLPTR